MMRISKSSLEYIFLLFVVLLLVAFLVANLQKSSESRKNMDSLPPVILWVWEREENLSFLADKNIGVALLAGSIEIHPDGVDIRPRIQRVKIPETTSVIPVVRIDNFRNSDGFSEKELLAIANFILSICSQDNISACQIDFEPRLSERNLYASLIGAIKDNLPRDVPLSLTTLVSWCNKGSWLENLPADEVVPMFYRLGDDEAAIRKGLVGEDFMEADICQSAIGIITDEDLPDARYIKGKRIYIFNPEPWNNENFSVIMKRLEEHD